MKIVVTPPSHFALLKEPLSKFSRFDLVGLSIWETIKKKKKQGKEKKEKIGGKI